MEVMAGPKGAALGPALRQGLAPLGQAVGRDRKSATRFRGIHPPRLLCPPARRGAVRSDALSRAPQDHHPDAAGWAAAR